MPRSPWPSSVRVSRRPGSSASSRKSHTASTACLTVSSRSGSEITLICWGNRRCWRVRINKPVRLPAGFLRIRAKPGPGAIAVAQGLCRNQRRLAQVAFLFRTRSESTPLPDRRWCRVRRSRAVGDSRSARRERSNANQCRQCARRGKPDETNRHDRPFLLVCVEKLPLPQRDARHQHAGTHG